jgi:hypothetical protein
MLLSADPGDERRMQSLKADRVLGWFELLSSTTKKLHPES